MMKSSKGCVPVWSCRPPRQQGAALLVALVLLVAVTLLGVSAMQGTILQERMSANQRDVEEAFNASEIGLRAGERALLNNPASFLSDEPLAGNPGRYASDIADEDWEDFDPVNWPTGMDASNYASVPLFHVAYRGDICPDDVGAECDELFTVTARGTGRTDTTFVVLQSTYRITP